MTLKNDGHAFMSIEDSPAGLTASGSSPIVRAYLCGMIFNVEQKSKLILAIVQYLPAYSEVYFVSLLKTNAHSFPVMAFL